VNLSRQTLRVYAAISSLREHSNDDVLDALLPFLVPLISVFRGRKFVPQMLVLGVKRTYGWTITDGIANAFRERLCAKGLLTQSGQGQQAAWICTPPENHNRPPDDDVDHGAQLSLAAREFSQFCVEKGDLFAIAKSSEELEDILIRFLVSLDAFSKETIIAEVQNFQRNDPGLAPLEELPEGSSALGSNDKYLCARFIKHLYDQNLPSLDFLGSLASVGLLTELIQDFLKPSHLASHCNLTIFLDAPIAMELVGLEGKAAREAAELVFSSLKSIGCQFAILPTSCKEITRVLSGLEKTHPSERFGPIHSAFLSGEVVPDFIHLVMLDPESALKKLGISVRPVSLDDYPNQHRYFPGDLYNDFVPEIRWHSDSARLHDAECLTITMRLREGVSNRDPLANKILFVTSNHRFALQARKYCIAKNLIRPEHCGPVIHQADLATAGWLRTGFGASKNIPRSHLVNVCGQILNVKKEFPQRAREIIRNSDENKLRQFDLLMQDQRAVTRLMDRAHSNEDFFADATAEKLLNDLLRATTEEQEKEHQTKIRELLTQQEKNRRKSRASHDLELRARDEELERQRNIIAASQQALAEQATEVARLAEERAKARLLKYTAIADATTAANLQIIKAERYIAGMLYIMMFLGIGGLLLASFATATPHRAFQIIPTLFSIGGAYYLIQDFRLKPKILLDDLVRRWAYAKLRDELSEREVSVPTGLSAVNFSAGRFVVQGKVDLGI